MNISGDLQKMIQQAEATSVVTGWRRTVLADIESRLTDLGFPCVFARNAFQKRLLRFVFVKDSGPYGIAHLAGGLAEYVEVSRRWDGRLDTAYPLIVAFAPGAVTARTVEEYHAFGWRVLQELHELDPAPWPDGVGWNPDARSWSMCFNGLPLFCNMSSSAHRVRRSRNLGGNFIMVVNPRERFDVFAGDTPSGRKVRSNIRGRIARYDGLPHSQQLGSYGGGALEWRQYGLFEDDTEGAEKCPFTFRSR